MINMLDDFNVVPPNKTEGYLVIIDPVVKDYLLIKTKDIWLRFKRAQEGSLGGFKQRYSSQPTEAQVDNFKMRWIAGKPDEIKPRVIHTLTMDGYSQSDTNITRDHSGPYKVYLVAHNLSSRYAVFIRKETTPPVTHGVAMSTFNNSKKDNVIKFLKNYYTKLAERDFTFKTYPEVFETKEAARIKVNNIVKRRGNDLRLM